MATAGKVAPTPKDKFVNGTAYDKLDVVEYNGTLYIAKKASAGVLPTDTEYWMLAVDLTGKLDTTGDTENNTVTFESGDEADPTAWKNVNVLSSKEKHSSLLKKISTMFSNVRYLYKLLGTTDISALGTVTQALANLDGNVGDIKGIISSLADCSAATVAGYAADALAVKELNSNLPKCDVIEAVKVSQILDSNEVKFGIYDSYAILQPDYSPISNKKILATILTHVGTDYTVNGTVTPDVFVSDISSTDGITINQIRVFSNNIRTIRAKISVLYTD